MQETITTSRLSIHLLRIEDHEFIRELVNTQGWLQYIGDRNIHSDGDALRYVQHVLNSPAVTYWVVTIKQTDTSIGIVSLIKRAYLEHFDIGFAFLPQHVGLGYAYEATGALLAMLHHLPEYKTMLATTVPENTKSVGLLKKLGFHYSHELEVETTKLHIYSYKA